MDGKNKNISDTFGKYNSSAGEVKEVNSSMWEPISAGRSNAGISQPQKKTAQKKTAPQTSKAKNGKKRSAAKTDKKSADGQPGLISQGRPDEKKKKSPPKKQTSVPAGQKKAAKSKKNPPSRTPKGRDLRKNARENQKHREELFKFREDYRQQINSQLNHDEISRVRNDNKRKKQGRRNAVTVGSVLFFALIFIIIYVYSSGAIIEKVIVYGESIYTSEEIQLAAGISPGKNMFSLRENKVRREITKKLPYIKDVEMEYDLPDTLVLTVRGTSDKYVITGQNSWITLDGDCKVVSDVRGDLKSGLFRADGFDYQPLAPGDIFTPEGVNEERFILLEKLVGLFEESKIVDSAVINLQNMQEVTVTVDGKIMIYLGSCKNLEEKVPYASKIVEAVRPSGKTGYIDLHSELGFFKPGSMTIQ